MLKKKSGYVVAVVGATGAVGTEMIEVLEERKFPVGHVWSCLHRIVRPVVGDICQGKEVAG